MNIACIFPFLASLLFVLVSSGTSSVVSHGPCKDGFLQMGKECYKFTRMPQKSFITAKTYCRKLGSHLADISSETRKTQVLKLIKRHGFREQSYWISMENDNSTQANDQAPIAAHSCNVIFRSPAYNIRNVACNGRHLFVCQHQANVSKANVRSRDGSFSCVGQYGYFPHPTDCARYVLCLNENQFVFRCTTGSVFVKQLQRCVADAVCSNQTAGADDEENEQEREEADDSTEFVAAGGKSTYTCERGYKRHRSHCYKVFSTTVQWNVANNTCVNDENGRLATVPSRTFMTFLRKLVRKSISDYWIGLNDKNVSDRYVWSNQNVLLNEHYENWSRQARKKFKRHKNCVKLSNAHNFQWLDARCADENAFICEKDASRTFKQPSAYCGLFHRQGYPRIEAVVGGTHAQGKTHPWQVSLRFQGDHKCGGSLIDRCWVMTAAHCVSPTSIFPGEEPTEAVLGDFHLITPEENEERLRIERIFIHPEWISYPIPTNDIAIIKLGRCSRKHNPICLPPSQDFTFPAGTECNIAGYGTVNPSREVYPEFLMEATVPLIDFQTCKSLYTKRRNRHRQTQITNSMFCAGYLEGGIDACQGDSGGPLTCTDETTRRERQWGIVSWGNGCAKANKPGVYTKIVHFYEWIRNITYINF